MGGAAVPHRAQERILDKRIQGQNIEVGQRAENRACEQRSATVLGRHTYRCDGGA